MRGSQGEPATAPARRSLTRSLARSCCVWSSSVSRSLPTPRLPPPPSALRSPRPLLLAASPVTSYCKCDSLKRSLTPTEGSNLQAAVVSVA